MDQSTTAVPAFAVATTQVSAETVFDFTQFESLTQADVRIKDPITGASTPMVVTIASPEHPARKRLVQAKQRRLRQSILKNGKPQLGDPEDDEADELDLLVASTLGWSGAPVPYSPEQVRTLYADPARIWLRQQVATALNDMELFTKRCAKS